MLSQNLLIFFSKKKKKKRIKMYRNGKKNQYLPFPYPTLSDPTGYRLLVVGKVQYSMYSTRFDRWVGKVGSKLVGKVVENGLLGIFPLEHSFLLPTDPGKSMGCMYLITLCMHVCFRKKNVR